MDHQAGGVLFKLYPLARKKGAATLICYQVGSDRRRDTFKGDLAAAQAECKKLAKTVTTGDAALHLSPLDKRVWMSAKEVATRLGRPVDAICREYAEAAAVLGGSASLLEAVRDWRRRHRTGYPRAPLSQVVEELLTYLQGKRRQDSTVKSLRIPLRRLAASLQVPIADIQTAEIERWLQLYPANAGRTSNNWIRGIRRLFNFAKGRYLPPESKTAADALELVTDDRRAKPVAIFQPWELAKLLHHAPPDLRRLIALGAFAGLRTIELHRLDWSALHWDPSPGYPHGHVEVRGDVAKQHRTAQRRIVPLQPNLLAWLEDARFLVGRVSTYASDRGLSAAVSRVLTAVNQVQKKHRQPLLSRPDNGARHSYGSYRLPVLGNVDLLALEMGNSRQEINRDYRELVHPTRVPEYWTIVPVTAGPVEQIEFTAAGF